MDESEKNRRTEMPDLLRACGWQQSDEDRCQFDAGTSSSDGVYFTYQAATDHFTLVVVGRMVETPYELNRRIGGRYRVCGLWVLQPSPRMPYATAKTLMDRGFYRIDFEPWELAERRREGEVLPRVIPLPALHPDYSVAENWSPPVKMPAGSP
jgi:hypothetical protein